jgi:hypothetical protein
LIFYFFFCFFLFALRSLFCEFVGDELSSSTRPLCKGNAGDERRYWSFFFFSKTTLDGLVRLSFCVGRDVFCT